MRHNILECISASQTCESLVNKQALAMGTIILSKFKLWLSLAPMRSCTLPFNHNILDNPAGLRRSSLSFASMVLYVQG